MIKTINKIILIGIFLLVYAISALAANPLRTLNQVFPNLSTEQRVNALSQNGIRNIFTKYEKPAIVPAQNSGIDLMGETLKKTPYHLVEALVVVPYNRRPLNTLDAYNAIGRVGNLSNYTVRTNRGQVIHLFEETTRYPLSNRNVSIPDPPPATVLPDQETIYIRIKDYFFGNTYFRGDFSTNANGITFNITNHVAVWYLVFPVMGAEKLAMHVYIEPIREGMLVYGLAGIDIPEFIATKINLTADINRRVRIIINWNSDNLKAIV